MPVRSRAPGNHENARSALECGGLTPPWLHADRGFPGMNWIEAEGDFALRAELKAASSRRTPRRLRHTDCLSRARFLVSFGSSQWQANEVLHSLFSPGASTSRPVGHLGPWSQAGHFTRLRAGEVHLPPSRNAKLLHAVDQAGTRHPQPRRRAVRTADHPFSLIERPKDV